MSNSYYQPPKLRSIFIGIVLFLAMAMLLCSLADVVKLLGAPLLFFPAKLGIIQDVGPTDVVDVKLATSPSRFNLTRPGLYAIYTGDVDLLQITNDLIESHASPWVKIKSLRSGQPVAVSLVERGLLPFDSALVKGRPIFRFTIATPGTYEMTHPIRPASIVSIIPDNTTGKEAIIIVAFIVEIAILLSPVMVIGYRRYRRDQAVHAQRLAYTKQVDEFWETKIAKRQDEERKKEK